jgi:hypothetical protein
VLREERKLFVRSRRDSEEASEFHVGVQGRGVIVLGMNVDANDDNAQFVI